MARTAITPTTAPRVPTVSPSAGALDVSMTACDTSNYNSIAWTGKEGLIMHNSGASTQTITIDAVADSHGRDGAITDYSLAAGDYAFADLSDLIFKQTDGTIHVDCDSADVKIGAVILMGMA